MPDYRHPTPITYVIQYVSVKGNCPEWSDVSRDKEMEECWTDSDGLQFDDLEQARQYLAELRTCGNASDWRLVKRMVDVKILRD